MERTSINLRKVIKLTNLRQKHNESKSKFNKELSTSLSKEINLEMMFKNAKAKNPELSYNEWLMM
jgi:hypothetical protein